MLEIVWEDVWYHSDELHDLFKQMFLTSIKYDELFWEIRHVESTTKKTTKEFAEYIWKIEKWCLQNWFIIPWSMNSDTGIND